MPNLRHRHLQPEIMDEPGLDAGQHHQALNDLARVNWISNSAKILWPPIRDLALERRNAGDTRPVRVLDIATGGGDVPSRLWLRARRRGIPLEVAGCDFSPLAVEHARQTAAHLQAIVTFFSLNVLAEPIPTGYDVVMCSLFLHHLNDEQAVTVLGKMREAAGSLALVNDLARNRPGWWAAYIGTRLLSRSPVVHFDGPVSVEGAYTQAEALALAHKAGWSGARVARRFPFRYLLSWRRR
ncbi:MAG TPA: methyltransferase domain-containing protein [Gemmataceae bacterium]|jgi:2-polyprenyl-3-methyl-5-hydroxy-6-metoxy-1,4-benzoquinol methylase|nr:methyltransferase domain-containing protein [Gemmataceae bacterium]